MVTDIPSHMPPPCNVIFKGKGYRFDGQIPAYNPYLRRGKTAKVIIVTSLVVFVATIYARGYLNGQLTVFGFIALSLLMLVIGGVWHSRSTSATSVFISAPRDCSLTSSDADVFYARK